MAKKILLADDSLTIQKVVELTFTEEGYQVAVVGDGALAIQRIEEDPPDLVLADVVMPKKSGYEVCEFVKRSAALQHIPVLLLVGKFEPFDEERARRAGASGQILKPFQSNVLMQKVTDLLAAAAPAPAPVPAVAPAVPAGPLLTEVMEPFPATAEAEPAFAAPAAEPAPAGDPFGSEPEPTWMAEPLPAGTTGSATGQMERPADADLAPAESYALPEDPYAAPAEPFAGVPPVDAAQAQGEDPFAPQGPLSAGGAEAPAGEPFTEPAFAEEPFRRAPSAAAGPAAPPAGAGEAGTIALEDFPEDVLNAIVERVVQRMSPDLVREIAWQVVPELAELLIKKKLEELG